jgi:hypothetical protein
MDHSPAYIIAQYLIGEGLLVGPTDSGDWPVRVGSLPDGKLIPDNAVACIDTAPEKDGRLMIGENIFHYGVQILLRAKKYNIGYAKASAIASNLELVARVQEIIGAKTYRIDNVSATTGIVAIGQEEGTKRRELFSLNFLITLKEV